MHRQEGEQHLMRRIVEELQPNRLLPSLTAGLVSGILTVMFSISFAAMIFSGDLSEYLSAGIGLTLFSAVVLGVTVAITSSFPGAVAIPQECPAAILALVAAAVAASMPASARSEDIFITVAAAIAVTSFLTGAFFFGLGLFKLSSFIRFIPYPVIGGFLAGTGWLLIQGGIGIITGAPLNWGQLPFLIQAPVLIKWLPALVLAVGMLLVLRKFSHFLIIPAMIVGAAALFYGALLITGTSITDASNQGWLLGPFPGGSLWEPISYAEIARVNWSIIFGEFASLGTILVISLISLLLSASGLDLSTKQDIDLNHELKSSGMANMATALFAGPVGYLSLSLSALGRKMGSKSRLIGLTAAVVCGVVLLFGAPLLSYFPKPVLGSLILFIGLAFIIEWVYDAWFSLSKTDYFLVLVILVIVAAFGFLEGVAVGVLAAVVIFVVEYSRINVIKHELSGVNFRSNVDRSAANSRLLIAQGEQIYILKLQGYIFFGTADSILSRVREKAGDPEMATVKFVVLDFRLVTGMDSSALSSFVRMKNMAESSGIVLVFTNLSAEMTAQFEKGGALETDDKCIKKYADIDHAVEWCENQILISECLTEVQPQEKLREHLEEAFPASAQFQGFIQYLKRKQVQAGFELLRQGNPPEGLYFIESGRVTVQIANERGEPIRLRSMGPGTVVGELGLYLGLRATATVVTDMPSTIYHLTMDALGEMEEKSPEIASALHRFIVHLLGERLVNSNNSLKALLD